MQIVSDVLDRYTLAPVFARAGHTTAGGPTREMDDRTAAIIEQAFKLFMRNGIKSMTMDDVATQLHMSKKTLYEHFTDKNDLVERAVKHVSTQQREHIEAICRRGHNAIDELMEVNLFVAGMVGRMHPSIHFDLEKYHPAAWKYLLASKQAEIYDCTVRNMEKGIAEGLYREDLNVPVIARIYISRFDMCFDGELFPPHEHSFSEVLHEQFRYHVRGIASRKGLEYLEKKVKKERLPA